MHSVITHPFALKREMREQCHAQPGTHCFCAHAREKQGCVMNHLQRETVEQVNKPDMECKEATTPRKEGRSKQQRQRERHTTTCYKWRGRPTCKADTRRETQWKTHKMKESWMFYLLRFPLVEDCKFMANCIKKGEGCKRKRSKNIKVLVHKIEVLREYYFISFFYFQL